MANLTIIARDEVVHWVRVEAARRNTSISRLLGAWLEEKMGQEQTYDLAMARYLGRQAADLSRGTSYPGRDELHERAGLR